MPDNGNGSNPFGMPLVQPYGQTNIASEMIGVDEQVKALFLTLTYFMDEREAMDYADILYKCEKYNLAKQKIRWLYRIAAKVSIKGYRSSQIVDILTQIQRMAEESRKEKANDASPNRGVKTNA